MKTIKIFLASSEELDYDRLAFGNLVRRLDDMYEKRGIRIKLFEWEDYDAAFNERRKQEEYNDQVRDSDIFLALFYKKAGEFTIEEFNVATQGFKDHASPKVFTFCKDLQPGETESAELVEFKKRLFEEMGHYWCRYDSRESLQFQFVMQLQLVENNQMVELKVEEGNVTIDGMRIAPMDKLRFAAANEDYQKMVTELRDLSSDIEAFRLQIHSLDGNEAVISLLTTELQKKLDRHNQLKKDFEQFQQMLFNTAKRVAQLQGERITKDMRSAIDAFNEGKVRETIFILDRALSDDELEFEDYKQSKEITELKRQNMIRSIEANHFRACAIMTDVSLPIEERLAQAEKNYANADERAKETEYDKEKYALLLRDYQMFLHYAGKYGSAAEVGKRLITLLESVFGEEHEYTISTYINTGLDYYESGDSKKACDCLFKAVSICETLAKENRPNMASLYDAIGFVHETLGLGGNCKQALTYYNKALKIREKTLGCDNLDTANSYNYIGKVNARLKNYVIALKYFQKALKIYEKEHGTKDSVVASIYSNMGVVNNSLKEYEIALEDFNKALEVYREALGYEHPRIAAIYDNIGSVYSNSGNHPKALEYYNRALVIKVKTLGANHPDTASSYCIIGSVYETQNDYDKALIYYQKAIDIRLTTLGPMHLNTALLYEKIGVILEKLSDYLKALESLDKAIEVYDLLGEDHPYLYNLVGSIYAKLGNYSKAIEYYRRTIESLSATDEFETHPWKIEAKQKIEMLTERMKQ